MPGGFSRKIDLVQEQITEIVKQLHVNRLRVFSFNNTLRDHGMLAAGEDYGFEPMGGSAIWDSVGRAIERISVENHKDGQDLLVCITDGQDTGSSLGPEDVMKMAKERGLVLKVIYIGTEQLDVTSDMRDLITQVDDISDIKDITTRVFDDINDAEEQDKTCSISACVLPLAEESASFVPIVQEAVIEAVSYIERLTGLRYYPVTTYLVDRTTIDDFVPARETPDEEPPDDELKALIKEVSGLIWSVALNIHTIKFDAPGQPSRDDIKRYYHSRPRLSTESARKFRRYAEEAWGLWMYVRAIMSKDPKKAYSLSSDRIFIPELSEKEDFLQNCFDDMDEAVSVLKRLGKEFGHGLVLKDDYFHHAEPINLDLWHELLMLRPHALIKTEWQKLQACISGQRWKRDIDSIITAFSIAVDVIERLIGEYERAHNPMRALIQELNCYGTYHYRAQDPVELRKHMKKSGLPEWFHPVNTGFVLLSPEKISERLQSVKINAMGPDERQALLKRLIFATTIHEHVHAVTYEGIGDDCTGYTAPPAKQKNHHKIISESIAEWAELNFFRDDTEIYTIIHDHITSRTNLRYWPYYGALTLENAFLTSGRSEMFFTMLLNSFRKDNELAWDVFKLTQDL